jgi:type II secretory pathway component PulF
MFSTYRAVIRLAIIFCLLTSVAVAAPPELVRISTLAGGTGGDTLKVLLQIADTVERRTNRQVDTAVKLIEPAILCLVAACIGFLALGLLLPIFTLAGSLGTR